jgi:tight adherence protein B
LIPLLTGILFAAGVVVFFASIDAGRRRKLLAQPLQVELQAPPTTIRERFDQLFQAREVRAAQSAAKRPGKLTLAEQLSRADLKIRTSEWFLIRLGSVGVLALIGMLRFGIGWQFALLGILGWFVPRFYLRHKQRKRLKAFAGQLGDTLVLMSNALKTGYSMAQALDVVANRASPPISQEFDRVTKEVNLGAPIEEAMARMVRRTESPDLDLVNTAIAINRKIGGNLSEILESIAETIRDRIRIKGEMTTMTAQARGSGYMITGLPIVLGVFMYFVTPQYFAPMVASPIGIGMLVVAGVFVALGQVIMGKIATVDV